MSLREIEKDELTMRSRRAFIIIISAVIFEKRSDTSLLSMLPVSYYLRTWESKRGWSSGSPIIANGCFLMSVKMVVKNTLKLGSYKPFLPLI